MIENRPWSEVFAQAGEAWADAEAAASLLEDCKSAVLAEMCARLGDIAVNRAEQSVKASPEWREYIEKMVEARHQANLARVKMEATRMKFNEWQSKEANDRQEMRMVS